MADVHNPDLVGVVMVSQIHLLPNLGDWVRVEPFVVTRATDVIKMIINSSTTAAFPFVQRRQAADIAPVIVAPKQCDVIGHAHSLFIVFLHFLVDCPILRYVRGVGTHRLCNDLPLVGHDFFQHGDVGAFGHRRVIRPAQADGDDAFVILVAFNAFPPKVFKHIGVFGIVPTPECFLIATIPFFLCPEHRFLV